jgi:hypothetical protein
MKKLLLLVLFFFVISAQSQQKNNRYTQFDISTPLKGNSTYGEIDSNGIRSDYRFLPDGLSLKYGVGIDHKKWVSIGIQTGIDWIVTQKLVAVPVFVNFKLSPKFSEDVRVYVQAGYGKSFGIGRGSLIGVYRKISLGVENDDGISLFIQVSDFGIPFENIKSLSSLSIGLSLITF